MTRAKAIAISHQEEADIKTLFGFWMYLMTDCVIFASLFAAYLVLHNNTFGGPSAKELFSLPFSFTETIILLTSSFTSGIALLAVQTKDKKQVLVWLAITFLLGLSFIVMELYEFHHMVVSGHSWQISAFLTSYFTLVGTHGFHVSIGLVWLLVLMGQILYYDFTVHTARRHTCFSLFWHFLDLIWIFIFTIVYLMGAV